MTTPPPNSVPSELLQVLALASRVAVLTGAGMSAESGIPTFREAQTGLWSRYNPEDLATPQAFRRDARLVWEWYAWRRELVALAMPNPGHSALARLEQRFREFTLITQNVDGLHQRAGSRRVIELHGSLQRSRCFQENRVVDSWSETEEVPPRCPDCGGPLRPDVVWFGESLPSQALEAAWKAASRCQVFLSIGTSGLVEPAASLPYIAQRAGAIIVEINPSTTPLTPQADFILQQPSGKALPELLAALEM
jgi:NAD-dependent protein deacetylase/lipoamidase